MDRSVADQSLNVRLNKLHVLNGLEYLNGSQGRGAPTRRAPLRGERHWRGAAATQRFIQCNTDQIIYSILIIQILRTPFLIRVSSQFINH